MKYVSLTLLLSAMLTTVWLALGSLSIPVRAQTNSISFTTATLQGTSMSTGPTSLQFGPDGRLYVSVRLGTIYVYDITRDGPNDYIVTATEEIDLVKKIQNHDDDGTINNSDEVKNKRQVTGLLVTGTPQEPILYVTSSDPRIGAGAGGLDKNLDTNSGIISRLTQVEGEWNKVDLVRGLPRSEENHATNGMALDVATNTLYVTSGGFTNAGSPSVKFAFATEYALSAAILSVDLDAIDALPIKDDNGSMYLYDLPTVNDPEREDDGNNNDVNDPFGGNDGLNQAKIVPDGPVQIYSPGYRNAYDLVLTQAGQLFTVDNGANGSWGGFSADESANCTNDYVEGEPGSNGPTDDGRAQVNNLDNLHLVEEGFYGGHPTPIRGNPAGAGLYTHDGVDGVWRTSKSGPNPLPADWPPAPVADPRECDFINPGEGDKALLTFLESTNGIAEYTTDNFGGALKGDLITASFNTNGTIWRIDLGDEPVTNDGPSGVSKEVLASSVNTPLDVVAQRADQPFGGTIWFTAYLDQAIQIMEPTDYDGSSPIVCTNLDEIDSDDDNDGYSNADEIDNGTNPCSASDVPADNDEDHVSDLNDADDDNDGLSDDSDPFAIDSTNGLDLTIPVQYPFFNEIPGYGMWGVGFTGLMSDGETNYQSLYPDATNSVVAGGTGGLFTVNDISSGNAMGTVNTQLFGFQFGVSVDISSEPFDVRARVAGPFFDSSPTGQQAQGMFIGTGDQDNYLKVAVHANDGSLGIQVFHESDSEIRSQTIYPRNLEDVNILDLIITVDPVTAKVQPKISINENAALLQGEPIILDGALLNTIQSPDTAMAVGIIATSNGGPSFDATWDEIDISHDLLLINRAPTLLPLEDQVVVAGETLSMLITAEDPDSELSNQSLALALENYPAEMTLADDGDGNWSLTWATTSTDIGVHTVDVIVTDSAGESTASMLTVSVSPENTPPQVQINGAPMGAQVETITLAENESRNVQISATDPDADSVKWTVSGLPSYARFKENGDGTASLLLTPTFADAGEATISLNATDSQGGTSVIALVLNVTDVNHPPQVDTSSGGVPQRAEIGVGETLILPLAFTDADRDKLTLALNSDKMPEGLTLTDNGDGTGVITWQRAEPTNNTSSYALTVVATDAKGASTERAIVIEFSNQKIYFPYYR